MLGLCRRIKLGRAKQAKGHFGVHLKRSPPGILTERASQIGAGFEPARQLPAYSVFRGAHSTTLPPCHFWRPERCGRGNSPLQEERENRVAARAAPVGVALAPTIKANW